jgi:hypothetical protein
VGASTIVLAIIWTILFRSKEDDLNKEDKIK